MSIDKKLATEVAKQLDRRRLRRKLLVLALFVAAVVLAITYLTCGQGFGLGSKGKGEGSSKTLVAPTADAAPVRCAVRVHAKGITVDGKDVTRDQAVAACTTAAGADVVITGDARQGDWDELRTALEQAGVAIYTRN